MVDQITNLFIFESLLKVLQQGSELVHGVFGEVVTESVHDWVVKLTGHTAALEVEPLAQSPLSLRPGQGGVMEPVAVGYFLPGPDQSPGKQEDLVTVDNSHSGGVTRVVHTPS